jgi:hypothetical protein
MADNHNILKGIIQLIAIITLTIFFFSYFSKKTMKLKKLFPLVMLFVWISISFMLGFEYLFFRDSSMLFSFEGIISVLKESLPMSLIFGSLIFLIKYRSFRKKMN